MKEEQSVVQQDSYGCLAGQERPHLSFCPITLQQVSLWLVVRRKYAPLFASTGPPDVSAFLKQNNNKPPFFLHEILAFYEQASSRTS